MSNHSIKTLISSIFRNYYVRRILPFLIAFCGFEFIEVACTTIWSHKQVDFDLPDITYSMFSVALETLVVFLHWIIPFLIFLAFLPRSRHGGKIDKTVTIIFFGIFVGVSIFTEVAELFFWEEFAARFNFIAVDYLVYTTEVVGNIYQSYPIIPIIAGIVLFAAAITFFARKIIVHNGAPRFAVRLSVLGSAIVLCIAAFFGIDLSMADGSGNRYNDELGKNGVYSLFSAFLHNELSYEDFYPMIPQETATEKIRAEYADQPGLKFINPNGNDIRRTVTPAAGTQPKKLNVMLVLMESMGNEFLHGNDQGRILTPNLDKLATQGIYFSNCYATGTRSVRGIEAVSTSIPPLPGMSIVRRDGNEGIETIGTFFRQKNYDTRWVYGGFGVFDNMNYFFANNGFEIVDRSNFADDEITHTTVWGVCDEDLFKRAIKEADKSFSAGTPFLNFVFTTSNHRPYAYPEGKIDIPSKTGRAGAVKYADFAVGELLRLAKEHPWFDDTLFVFVADHCSSSAGRKELNPERHHIPLIFYAPKHFAPRRVDVPVSQIDALPTLLGLLDFDYTASFYGRDALAPNYHSRTFISNYQAIGFRRGDELVVMKPVRETLIYDGSIAEPEKILETSPQKAWTAVSYYQHASNWRKWLKPEIEKSSKK